MKNTLIIGSGIASVTVAESLRGDGFNGEITIIGEENRLPYQRPPLSKSCLVCDEEPTLPLIRPASFYENRNIKFKLGRKVVKVNRLSMTVELDGGEVLSYDFLIFATGARPRILKLDKSSPKNVYYLRTFEDSIALRKVILDPAVENIAILGAGVIGLEVACAFNSHKKKVTVIEANHRSMSRVASPVTTNFIERTLSEIGISFRFNSLLKEFQYSGENVAGLMMSDGTVQQADIVVIGIGAVPNTELAQLAGINCDDGILVDTNMCTSDPNIYAIGDCSKVTTPFSSVSVPLRIETIHNAMLTAKTASAHICGKPTPHQSAPRFWSDLDGMKVQSIGICKDYDKIYRKPNSDDNTREFWLYSKNCIIGTETINLPAKQSILSAAISKRS
tara:strand:- start:2307 stop:3479 length:1173 start_codon:yes stop_codon:yes gene_type:complete